MNSVGVSKRIDYIDLAKGSVSCSLFLIMFAKYMAIQIIF